MTWPPSKKPKKKYPFRRWCKARCSPDCQIIFRSNHKRTRTCKNCKKKMATLKLNEKRYLKMTQENNYEEKVTWKDSEKCTLVYTEDKVVNNDKGELIAKSNQTITAETNKSDMIANLKDREAILKKNEQKAATIMGKIKAIGKRPVKTAEMVRIQKAIGDLHKIEEYDKLQSQLANVDKDIKDDSQFIKIRKKSLDQAPKE